MKIRSLVIRPGGCFPTPPSRNDIRDPRYLVALIAGRYVTQGNDRYSATRNADDDENDETAVRVGDRAIQLSLSPALSQRGSTFTPAHDSARDPPIEFAVREVRASCCRIIKRCSSPSVV